MSRKRQAGFSLIELLIAMMIIAVIGTLGFKQFKTHSAKARHLKASDSVRLVAEALDQYYLKHGVYPDFTSYEAMVDSNSVLVKESLIPVNVPSKDPWGQAYEARSDKGKYFFKCQGDPSNPDDAELGWFTREPGKLAGSGDAAATGNAGAAQGAPGAAK